MTRRRPARGTLSASARRRLETQLESLPAILGEATAGEIGTRPPTGQWSARENLAHLARHHEVMLERLERILAEDEPRFERYRAEEDPAWPHWSDRSTAEVLKALSRLRSRLVVRVRALTPAQAARVGVHARFGRMTVGRWVEFFLVHEAHHLYVILGRLADAGATVKSRSKAPRSVWNG